MRSLFEFTIILFVSSAIGIIAGYWIDTVFLHSNQYMSIAYSRSADGPEFATLRGTVRSIDFSSHVVLFDALSPYDGSVLPMRISYDDSTSIFPGTLRESVRIGGYARIVVTRGVPGPLLAKYISVIDSSSS